MGGSFPLLPHLLALKRFIRTTALYWIVYECKGHSKFINLLRLQGKKIPNFFSIFGKILLLGSIVHAFGAQAESSQG